MKKGAITILTLIPLLVLGGCLAEIVFYRHEPTDRLTRDVRAEDFKSYEEFVFHGVLIFPNFGEFSPEEYISRSFLAFYSLEPGTVEVDGITLLGKEKGERVQLELRKSITVNREKDKNGIYSSSVLLTGLAHIDLSKLKGEKVIILEVQVKVNGNEVQSIHYELQRHERKDIAWAT